MIKAFGILLPAVVIAAAGNQAPVVISGTATDCYQGEVLKIHDMEVRALDPSTNKELVTLLRSMDTLTWVGDGVATQARFEPMYTRMVYLFRSSAPLARDSTTAAGTFSLTVPSSDSVLVIAQADLEDDPLYAYRMVNARTNVNFELDMSRGYCGVHAIVQRTAAGFIFQDNFNRADGPPGSNWEIRGNASFWSIAGNVLKAKPTDGTLQQILVATSVFGAARAEMVVQVRMRRVGTARTTFPGIQARHDAAGKSSFRWGMSNSADATLDEFDRTLTGANTVLNTSPSYNSDNLWQQFKLAIRDSQQQGWKDGVLSVNLTDAALNAVTGRAGLSTGWYTSTSDYHEFDDFAVYKRNVVTMSDLPAGYTLRVGTRTGVESGGTATVDLLGDLCPRVKVEVLNVGGLVIAQLTPSGGVWGGDTYSYTP